MVVEEPRMNWYLLRIYIICMPSLAVNLPHNTDVIFKFAKEPSPLLVLHRSDHAVLEAV